VLAGVVRSDGGPELEKVVTWFWMRYGGKQLKEKLLGKSTGIKHSPAISSTGFNG